MMARLAGSHSCQNMGCIFLRLKDEEDENRRREDERRRREELRQQEIDRFTLPQHNYYRIIFYRN